MLPQFHLRTTTTSSSCSLGRSVYPFLVLQRLCILHTSSMLNFVSSFLFPLSSPPPFELSASIPEPIEEDFRRDILDPCRSGPNDPQSSAINLCIVSEIESEHRALSPTWMFHLIVRVCSVTFIPRLSIVCWQATFRYLILHETINQCLSR